jgi:hypothetical protein
MLVFFGKIAADLTMALLGGVLESERMFLGQRSSPKQRGVSTWHRNVCLGIMMTAALHNLLG